MTQVTTRNLLVLGDLAVPPRSLLEAIERGTCSRERLSEILRFDGQAVRVLVKGKYLDQNFWDKQPDAEYPGPRRRLSPTVVHIILLSFAIDSPNSLESVKEERTQHTLSLYPRVPILLVGCNKDLRNNSSLKKHLESMKQVPVTWEKGEEVARYIQAIKYIECSQWTGEGVPGVVEAAARASLMTKKRRQVQRCDVM
ncbi:GTP-binding protein rhoA [Aspergillus insuetus]